MATSPGPLSAVAEAVSLRAVQSASSLCSAWWNSWPCPAPTDTRDRLNGLRGVDGGEQQTAPVLPGRVQARGGGRGPRWPLDFGGGGRTRLAGPAGACLAALGGGPHGGWERRAGTNQGAGGAGAPRGPEPGGSGRRDRTAAT